MKAMYVPGEGAPATVSAYGRKWRANVPIELSDKDTYLIMETVATQAGDGSTVRTARERQVPITEIMAGNPQFQLGDERKEAAQPITADQVETALDYRRYVKQWLTEETRVEELKQRWEDDEGLRERAGVGDDDVKFLRTFVSGRVRELEMLAKEERQARRMGR